VWGFEPDDLCVACLLLPLQDIVFLAAALKGVRDALGVITGQSTRFTGDK